MDMLLFGVICTFGLLTSKFKAHNNAYYENISHNYWSEQSMNLFFGIYGNEQINIDTDRVFVFEKYAN